MATHPTITTDTNDADQAVHWAPCPTCWGRRHIWTRTQAANGEGAILVATACRSCLGIGEVVR